MSAPPDAPEERPDPPEERPERPLELPAAVRGRVAALAADRLGALPPEQVPASLRAFARFHPAKRARLAAVPISTALETDSVFRQRVAEALREALPDLAAAVTDGAPLPAVAPEDVAAVAYVLRPAGWRDLVDRLSEELAARTARDSAVVEVDTVRRLTEQLEALRAGGRAEADRLRADAESARAEAVSVRRRLRELGDRLGRAEAAQRAAELALRDERAALQVEREQVEERVRAAEAERVRAERALAAGRQVAREGRAADELRLRVLLDALLGAAAGLRRELALPPAQGRPADSLSPAWAAAAAGAPQRQGRDPDDPSLLDALLGVPLVHLLVDGYNVTKEGYGELELQAQRARLLAGLGALAARTAAEVTVVFDGVEHASGRAAPAPRGVRLLFSREGETADEVLRTLVRHEPAGRPVVVVSTDREVADGVRAAGAQAVPSRALLRLLSRS